MEDGGGIAVSSTVSIEGFEQHVVRPGQVVLEMEEVGRQETGDESTEVSERLPNYQEVIRSCRPTDGEGEEGNWLPVYRERNDGEGDGDGEVDDGGGGGGDGRGVEHERSANDGMVGSGDGHEEYLASPAL